MASYDHGTRVPVLQGCFRELHVCLFRDGPAWVSYGSAFVIPPVCDRSAGFAAVHPTVCLFVSLCVHNMITLKLSK